MTLALVAAFPLLLWLGYGAVFAVARARAGRAGLAWAQNAAPLLFPVFLAVPLAAVLWHEPALLGLLHLQLPWAAAVLAGGVVLGAVLFHGESLLNAWMARRRGASAPDALEGFIFIPWLMPMLSVFVTLAEELIWRGFLIGELQQQGLGTALALAVSALLFSLHHGHFGLHTAAYKGFCAIVWGLLFAATGSLLPGLLAHLAADLLAWRRMATLAHLKSLNKESAAMAPSSPPSAAPGAPALLAESLSKSYGAQCALRDLHLRIERGEVFGLLGPNGAGKTTAIECITGLQQADRGRACLLGQPVTLRHRPGPELLGVQLQNARFFANLSVQENLELVASFSGHTAAVDRVIDQLLLGEQRHKRYKQLSGGQRQRVAVAAVLLADPEVFFLDEMSTGLDPVAREELWQALLALKARGKTIVFSTHFMDEAVRLCDRIGFVKSGRLVAVGPREELARQMAHAGAVEVLVQGPLDPRILAPVIGDAAADWRPDGVRVHGRDASLVAPLVLALHEAGIVVKRVGVSEPTLEELFRFFTDDAPPMAALSPPSAGTPGARPVLATAA